jgi:FkbM family methyltransferase
MLPNSIRKLSCNPVIRSVGAWLHINHLGRRVYCWLLSSGGVLEVSCLGVEASFKTNSTKQLAFVDYILTTEREFIEAALSDLREGDTFLDVGSHYGIFSILASKLVGSKGRVIAVEPHPGALQVLRENIAINGCHNLQLLSVAFSRATGAISLAFNENGAGPQSATDPEFAVHTVQGVAGDEALQSVPVPAVAKIDVEGQEYAVLMGLKRTLSNECCRRLCLEIHPSLLPPDIDQDTIRAFVRDCGFQILSERVRSLTVHLVAGR